MNALVADDDELNRIMLKRILVRRGWSVDEATDGQSAVDACDRCAYNLVLLDICMTGMSGHEAAGFIIKNHETKPEPKPHRPKLVAVTGADRKCIKDFSGFDGYLQKPFMLSELDFCLNTLFLNRGG
jgi:CheY-like chemotaxis protein